MASEKQIITLIAMAKERGLDPQPIIDEQAAGTLVNARVDKLFKVLKSKPRVSQTIATVKSDNVVTTTTTTVVAAPATVAAEGYYTQGGKYYKVMWNRTGTRRYGRLLAIVEVDGKQKAHWVAEGAKGVVYHLTEADRLTPGQAKAFGDLYHFCVCCGKELTVPLSIERGVGPVCWGKMGW